jgi:hypothetical protein
MQYRKKLVSINSTTSGVTVTFDDTTTATGSICIGTDGAQSSVRQLAIPGEAGRAIPMDVILYNLTVCYGNAQRSKEVRKVHFMNSVALHPEKHLSIWTSSKFYDLRLLRAFANFFQSKMCLTLTNRKPGNFRLCQPGLLMGRPTSVAPKGWLNSESSVNTSQSRGSPLSNGSPTTQM